MEAVNGQQGLGIIRVLTGRQAGHIFSIQKPTTTIGRARTSDVVIEDDYVSRAHAELHWNNGMWTITKNGAAGQNKLLVNNQEVVQSAPLHIGDSIKLGPEPFTTLLLEAVAPALPQNEAKVDNSEDITKTSPRVQAVRSNTPPSKAQPVPSAQPIQPVQPGQTVQPVMPNVPATPNLNKQGNVTQFASTVPSNLPPGVDQTDKLRLGEHGTRQYGVPFLEVTNNINADKVAYQLTRPVISIGYDPSNDVPINIRIVSGFHARIVQKGEQWVLEYPHPARRGTGTLNGIQYQGQQILGAEPFSRILESGDIFRIGDEDGVLVTLTYYDGKTLPQDTIPNISPIQLDQTPITIGRHTDNRVILNHPLVSAHHALLQPTPQGYSIIDLRSTNHVFVNGVPITVTHLLQLNDEIRIGPFRFYYTGTQLTGFDERNRVHIIARQLKKINTQHTIQLGALGPLKALEFVHSRTDLKEADPRKDLKIDIPGVIRVTTQQIHLLNGISIAIPSKKFVAIVGGSGAGKSTLMEALNGVQPAIEGKVLYNGQNYYRNMSAFSKQLGYVPQADIVHADLTVERALYYAAKIRLPSDYIDTQIRERIVEVLNDVDLTHKSKSLIGKLSGGQRKRVSIALELLANPSVFFLDEPTSGLDPGLDLKMMKLLRRLADRGRTVILVTHATNNIHGCDYVCFLCRGGRLAYFGPPKEALKFFGKDDFAQIYSALEPTDEKPNIPEEVEAHFRASPDYNLYVVEQLRQVSTAPINQQQVPGEVSRRPKISHRFRQFRLLTQRYLELLWNDKANLAILLLQAPIIALILVFMIQYLIGTNVFSSTKVMQCNSINYTHALDINVTKQSVGPGQNKVVDCNSVLHYLQKPTEKTYLSKYYSGNANKALQDFIVQGAGSDAQKILFIMAFAALMFGCINSVREIVKEAPIYQRERTVNLGIVPYMFSKIAVLGMLSLFQSAVLVIIVNIAAHFHQGAYDQGVLFKNNLLIVEIYITLALTSLVGAMLGLVVSALSPNSDRAMSFIPIILIPQVIFSGFLFALNKDLLQGIGAFFAVRWSIAGLGTSVGLNEHALQADGFTYHSTLFSTYDQAEATRHMLLVWGALFAMIVLLAILVAIFLKRKDVKIPA